MFDLTGSVSDDFEDYSLTVFDVVLIVVVY